jgi:phosphate transport system substrate-binding protein
MKFKGAKLGIVLIVMGLTAVVIIVGGCSRMQPTPVQPTAEPLSGKVTFAGSTTVQPLAAALGQAFNETYPNVTLDIAAGGSSVGIKAIHDGTVDIGMASRALSAEEADGIETHKIAVDVLAVVVHPDNPIDDLTYDQLAAIYRGEILNWKELGGPDAGIVAGIRETTSGTRKAFDKLVLDGETPSAPEVETCMTNGDVVALVKDTPTSIGYIGFGYLQEGLKSLSIDGVEATQENAVNASYTLMRPLQLLTGPLSQPLADSFIEFALSEEGQALVSESGWIAAN